MQSSCPLQSSENLLSSSTISSENLLSSSTIVLFDSGSKMITPMPLSREPTTVGYGGGQWQLRRSLNDYEEEQEKVEEDEEEDEIDSGHIRYTEAEREGEREIKRLGDAEGRAEGWGDTERENERERDGRWILDTAELPHQFLATAEAVLKDKRQKATTGGERWEQVGDGSGGYGGGGDADSGSFQDEGEQEPVESTQERKETREEQRRRVDCSPKFLAIASGWLREARDFHILYSNLPVFFG